MTEEETKIALELEEKKKHEEAHTEAPGATIEEVAVEGEEKKD